MVASLVVMTHAPHIPSVTVGHVLNPLFMRVFMRESIMKPTNQEEPKAYRRTTHDDSCSRTLHSSASPPVKRATTPGCYQRLEFYIQVLRVLCPNLTDASLFPFIIFSCVSFFCGLILFNERQMRSGNACFL